MTLFIKTECLACARTILIPGFLERSLARYEAEPPGYRSTTPEQPTPEFARAGCDKFELRIRLRIPVGKTALARTRQYLGRLHQSQAREHLTGVAEIDRNGSPWHQEFPPVALFYRYAAVGLA